jgi:iron complex transport system permease protein
MSLISFRSFFFYLLWTLLLFSVLLSACVGAVSISFTELWSIFLSELGMGSPFPFEEQQALVLKVIRLPRVVLGVLIGAGLAMAGAAIQGLFRNPLADPGLIGISAGASLFAVLMIVVEIHFFEQLKGIIGSYALSLAAFLGATLSTFLVYQLSKVAGKAVITTMLLAGIAINALVGALTGLMTYIANDEQLRNLTFWGLGSLGGATWASVLVALPLIGISLALLPSTAKALNLLALGEQQALHLGVNLKMLKRKVIILATLAVGTSVALAGTIGFVGFVVPHIIRLWAGADHRKVLIGSAIAGAAVLSLADAASRTIVAPAELPIGILTALLGTPVFLWILIKEKQK